MTPRKEKKHAAPSPAPARYRTPEPKDSKANSVAFVREVANPATGKRQAEFMERDPEGRDVLVHIVAEGAK